MISKVLLVSLFLGVALARDLNRVSRDKNSFGTPQHEYGNEHSFSGSSGAHHQQPYGGEYSTPAKYNFDWKVQDDYSNNDFGQQETRDGHDTQGSYYVLLPDGRQQTVTYYVNGDSGYVAEVNYEGNAQYPEKDRRQPSFQPQLQDFHHPEQQAYQPPHQQAYQPPHQQTYQLPISSY